MEQIIHDIKSKTRNLVDNSVEKWITHQKTHKIRQKITKNMEFSEIKGFGAKRIQQLQDAGIKKPAELLTYFPQRFIDTKHLSNLRDANDGERVVILAKMNERPKFFSPRRGMTIIKAKFIYDNATVWLTWFNQPFMARNLSEEKYYYIEGKLKKNKTTYEISTPRLFPFTGAEPPIIPIYKPIGKISATLIASAIKSIIGKLKIKGYVPDKITQQLGMMSIQQAIETMHNPTTMDELKKAQESLAIEKLSYMLSAYSLMRESVDRTRKHIYDVNKKCEIEQKIKTLPYELTRAQRNALTTIMDGFQKPERLNALIEGDVGCGKTIVALLSMYYAVLSKKQAIMMVPTEILAMQHYQSIQKLLGVEGVKCKYLSGSIAKKEREEIIKSIASGETQCIVGTHALLSDDVVFSNPGLVVIDEQHRFGVAQRARLENKTAGADCIVMSATPIPRTLALTLYGDLTQILINELPSKKANITTKYVPQEKEKDMWKYIMSCSEKGEKSFVVASRINDEEDELISAEGLYKEHKKEFGERIALLHGKQKETLKLSTMNDFANNNISVIVATTVIEVGIDVPKATTMVIYDADRFGLSQLHQLRGRVGRGEIDSYCFVLTESKSTDAKKRIEQFIGCKDGFKLAEYDFETRGAGDFLGYSQHGKDENLSLGIDGIKMCKRISEMMLSMEDVKEKIKNSLTNSASEYFSEITLN